MKQVLIDTKAVKNALAAVDKFCLKVRTGQAKSVETYHDLMLVGNDLRAAIANAELDTTQRDAELWRAYKARKDAAINAGMGKSVVRTGPMEWSEPE